MTFTEWREYAQQVNRRADRVHAMIIARARKDCKAAGLDPQLLGIHPHNAMVSLSYGSPWANVDYSLVRRCIWLQRKSWVPYDLASKINNRAWERVPR